MSRRNSPSSLAPSYRCGELDPYRAGVVWVGPDLNIALAGAMGQPFGEQLPGQEPHLLGVLAAPGAEPHLHGVRACW